MKVDKDLEGHRVRLVNIEKLCALNYCKGITSEYEKLLSDLTVVEVHPPHTSGGFLISTIPTDQIKDENTPWESWGVDIPFTDDEMACCFEVIED